MCGLCGEVDEFCDGLARLTLSETPVETLRMMRQLQLIRREADFQTLHATLARLDERLDDVCPAREESRSAPARPEAAARVHGRELRWRWRR